MRQTLSGFAVVLLSAGLVGCATLFTGTRDNVTISSNPAGALVLVDGLEMGRTPATIPIKRGFGDKVVTLRMEGQADRTFELQSTFNVATLVNIFFWPGFIVDAATGAMMKYSPVAYNVTMDPVRTGMARTLGVDHVVLLAELPTDAAGRFVIPEGADGLKIAVLDPLAQQAIILK